MILDSALRHPLRISGRLTLIAALFAAAVAVVPPAGYALIYDRFIGSMLAVEADLVAELASPLFADAAPGAGVDAKRLEPFVKGEPRREGVAFEALRREVLSADRAVLAQWGPGGTQFPLRLREERALRGPQGVVGYFAIEASLEPLVARTLEVAVASLAAGILIFAGLHLLPLRALRRAERDVSFLATHDPLTHLPNRALFRDRLEQSVQRAQRTRSKVGLFFLNLDHFKSVNDAVGYAAGDEVLVQAIVRMLRRIRASDTLARVSGDEFMVIAEGGHRPEDFLGLAQQLRAGFEEPILAGGREVFLTMSGGIALFPDDAGDAATLVRHADLAMADAKHRGRDNFRFFTPALSTEMARRAALHLRLRRALEHGEFRVHYQPIHCADCENACGYEALLRWEREPGEVVGPGEFIAALEETGLIVPVGDWVIEEVCRQMARWAAQGRGDVVVSVNVSGRQFHDGGLATRLRDSLARHGVEARRLVIEITESVLLDEEATAEAQLREVSRLGVGIALDDFGTGYSSLSYLQRFPLDCLKIDRSFVATLASGDGPASARIVEAIIGLAHGLGLHVTAEGIESAEQLEILRGLDCDRLQGYYFGRPRGEPEFGAASCSRARVTIAPASASKSTACAGSMANQYASPHAPAGCQ